MLAYPRAAAAGAEQGRDQAEDGAGVTARPRTGAVPTAVAVTAALGGNNQTGSGRGEDHH